MLTGITMDMLGKPAIFLSGLGALLFVVAIWGAIHICRFLAPAFRAPVSDSTVAEREAA